MGNNQQKLEKRDNFQRHVIERALQADKDEAGGYFLINELYDDILVAERSVSVIRAVCRELPPISKGGLGIPSQEAALSDATWTSELAAGAIADSTSPFGKRQLFPNPLIKRIRVSSNLLRKREHASDHVIDAVAESQATAQEKAFVRGSGAGEPQGIVTCDEVEKIATTEAGSLDRDDIVKWIFGLSARFLGQATRIITTPDFVRGLLNLKDGSGQPLFPTWRGRLFNVPVLFSDALESSADQDGNWIAGTNAAIVGDFSWYWIVDYDWIDLLRLNELYIEDNEVAFQSTQWTDGAPVIPEAFRVLTINS